MARAISRLLTRSLGILAVGVVACGDVAVPPEPPNIVLISIDTLRADHLHSYGYERATSPNIDRLAAGGVRFENAIAESSWTLPAHVSMVTGVSSGVHGVSFDGHKLGAAWRTLPELLAQQGYRTRGFWSGPYLHPIFGFGRGFAPGDYEGVIGESCYDAPGSASCDENALAETNLASHRMVTSPEIVDRAIAFLEGHEADQPFFLFLHLFDVHYDFVPPEEIWRRFDPDYDGDLTGEDFAASRDVHAAMTPRDLAHLVALYDGEIFFTDLHVGRFLDALDRLGLADDTLVVLTSDHGEEFLEHEGMGHRNTLFDEVLKVPLIVRLPSRIVAGKRVAKQVRHIDLMPTILELAGVPVPDVMGTSLAPTLLDPDEEPPDLPAVSHLVKKDREEKSIRSRTSKLLLITRPMGTEVAYFDHSEDPGERISLAIPGGSPAWQAAAEELRAFEAHEARLREAAGGSPDDRIELSPEMKDQLRQLGYAEDVD